MSVTFLSYKDSPNPVDYSEVVTVPDQSISLKELLDRYTMGMDISEYSNPGYFDDDDEDYYDDTENGEFDLADASEALYALEEDNPPTEVKKPVRTRKKRSDDDIGDNVDESTREQPAPASET